MALSGIRERYLEALTSGSESAAVLIIEEALGDSITPEHICVDVIGAAMQAIGDRWAAGSLTVAQEHRASEIASEELHDLLSRVELPADGIARNTAHVACAEGERHAFGCRIIDALLRLGGWDTEFLGADMPFKELIDYSSAKASVICLSVTMPENAVRLVENLKRLDRRIPLVVGGQGTEDKTISEALERAGAQVSDHQMLLQSVRFAAQLKTKRTPLRRCCARSAIAYRN